jgi:hypothetical protein
MFTIIGTLCAFVFSHPGDNAPFIAVGFIVDNNCSVSLLLYPDDETRPLEIKPGSGEEHKFRAIIGRQTAVLLIDGVPHKLEPWIPL